MKEAQVVGIIDHHGIGDVRNTERIAVFSLPVGAAASIVYKLYPDCGVEIPRDMARVLLMSILSDTKGMTSNVTQLDREAFDSLRVIAEIDDIDALYDGMKAAQTSFDGMTISSDMTDDRDFFKKLESGEYQLAVTHMVPQDDRFCYKKCGHEDLFISVQPGNPLAFYPVIHLRDLDGLSILLLQRIGFWSNIYQDKTPNSRYLLQIEQTSFDELAEKSALYHLYDFRPQLHRRARQHKIR